MFGSSKKWIRERLRRQWGKNPLEEGAYNRTAKRMERIRILHDEMAGQTAEDEIDDITWQDLEMDEVFWRLNNTRSFVGEQVLYHRLHEMRSVSDWERYEKQLAFFAEEEQQRVEIERRLHAIGKLDDAYVLPTFLANTDLWRIKRGWYLHILQILLLMFFVTSIILDNVFCIAGLAVVALTNLMVYLYMKQRYEGYLTALARLKQIYDFARWLMEDERLRALFGTAEAVDAVQELKGLSKLISNWNGRKYAGMSGDIVGIVNDYLWGVTLLDVASFNHIMKVIGDRREAVLAIVWLAGSVDAGIAVASYRAGAGEWCMPQASEEHAICMEHVVHPLLSDPVANDFALEGRAIITGANASGKSTFMKAVAINAILAQTIHTCSAAHARMPHVHVMTCMSLRDDVLSGESYYFREAKYLKRMLDQMERGVPTLCVLDEILKGTNTKERLAASDAILEYMASLDCFVLVATHDMELARRPDYGHYYFESRMEGADIVFDYQIHTGIGGTSNAIALLAALDFPETIVDQARRNLRAGQSALKFPETNERMGAGNVRADG